jgi:hypothetical protein
MNDDKVRNPPRAVRAADVIERCLASPNACDQRKGADLDHLAAQARHGWDRRFAIEGFAAAARLSLTALCRLHVHGLASLNGRVGPQECFRFALAIPHRYPLSLPVVKFVGDIPYSPHVVHRDFMPESAGLPPELQEYLRMGEGYCCYLRSSQWSIDLSSNLALVVWQVSRLLTLDKVFGEMGSLNPSARDYALRLRDEGKTPLGPSLPYPSERGPVARREPSGAEVDASTEAIEWVDHGAVRS